MELIAALIDLGAWNLIGLAGIVLIGLPHGALDGAVAMHLGIVQRFSDLARFMLVYICLLYTSPSPRDCRLSRMPSSA